MRGRWTQRLRRGCGRRFAPSCAMAPALPAHLPTNCPASSLSLLAGQFAQSSVGSGLVKHSALGSIGRVAERGGVVRSGKIPRGTGQWNPTLAQRTRKDGAPPGGGGAELHRSFVGGSPGEAEDSAASG
jgi:hypothetical protein